MDTKLDVKLERLYTDLVEKGHRKHVFVQRCKDVLGCSKERAEAFYNSKQKEVKEVFTFKQFVVQSMPKKLMEKK